jgi:ribA/ribD-fused uncharacterized protein
MNAVKSRSVEQLVRALEEGEAPRFLFFWGHRPAKDGRVRQSCFSQWYEAPFEVAGTAYPSAEHYMMAAKAALFGDMQTRGRILATTTPGAAKALGRQVEGFEEEVWARERMRIVVDANLGKFGQDARLADFLIGTGNQVLVEASPVDQVWGIGMAADDPDANHPARWRGLNLLGFALMEVRDVLARRHEIDSTR